MIFRESFLVVSDNSGVVSCVCIGFSSCVKNKNASIGDIIVVVIKKLKKKAASFSMRSFVKGQICKAIVVRTRKSSKNLFNGFLNIFFFDNAIILLNSKLEPIGSRVYGPIAIFYLKKKGYLKLLSLCVSSFF